MFDSDPLASAILAAIGQRSNGTYPAPNPIRMVPLVTVAVPPQAVISVTATADGTSTVIYDTHYGDDGPVVLASVDVPLSLDEVVRRVNNWPPPSAANVPAPSDAPNGPALSDAPEGDSIPTAEPDAHLAE
jgi:hypothetical protein